MREERVRLEDGVDGSPVGGKAGDVGAFDPDLALVRLLEPCDQAQRRRLAAAGGAEQREKLAVTDLEIELVPRL